MLIIAHRGASACAPEHTFAAWDLALEMRADYLEQDLQMTRDGQLIVMHDDRLDRTVTGGPRGRVLDHALADLRACDVGSWFNRVRPARARSEYAGQPIPTLDEVFGRYAGRACFYVETKKPAQAPGMERALIDLIDRHGLRAAAAREWRVLIQSFSERSLRMLHGLDASLPLIQLIPPGPLPRRRPRGLAPARLHRIAQYAVGIGPYYRNVNAALVTAAATHCLDVHPYTVNRPVSMKRLADAGVAGMFTDAPDLLLRLRPPDEPRGRDAAAAAAERHRRCRSARSR